MRDVSVEDFDYVVAMDSSVARDLRGIYPTINSRLISWDIHDPWRGVEFSSRLPMGRFGQPDEAARMVLVLASDMSSYVHGALIPVDGGFLSA